MTQPQVQRPSTRTRCIDVVTETYFPEVNGVAHMLRNVVDGLRDRGHDVGVIRPRQDNETVSPSDDDLNADTLRLPGMPIPFYTQLRFGFPAKRRLLRRWTQRRPDAVYIATEGPLGQSALAAARQLEIPVLSGFHTNFHQYSRFYGVGFLEPLVAAQLRRFHNRCRATVVPTAKLRDELTERGFERVEVLGRGVDTALFNPGRRDAALRLQWGADEATPVALYVGRLAPEKNLAVTVRAFEALRERLPDARLVLVGDGPSRNSVSKDCPDCHFAGVQRGEALAAHYASADLFLFASTSETYGNVYLEAMASGLPTWAYDYAAAHEHVVDECSGFLVELDKAEERSGERFVAAAARVAAKVNEWREMGQQARERGASLSWGRIVSRVEDLMFEDGSTVIDEVHDAIS
ncbi:MAG: glycosyltransferase family 4 protein [Thioalkalivibrionaceae bacterium]